MEDLIIKVDQIQSHRKSSAGGSCYQSPKDQSSHDIYDWKIATSLMEMNGSNNRNSFQKHLPSYFRKRYPSKLQRNFSSSTLLDLILISTLGSIMGILSFGVDLWLHKILHFREILLSIFDGHIFDQFLIWSFYAIILVTTSAAICHHFGPQARGSGFPEIKVSCRGILMKEFYTFQTFFTKLFAIPLFIASGSPIGKEAPFVHLSSIMAHQLSKLSKRVINEYRNESRRSEMLAAGCAVGIACTFGSPVGAVFYALEATNVYFETINVKRCLLAATCSSTFYRVLILFGDSSNSNGFFSAVISTYQTNFPRYCYSFTQIPLFMLLGFICSLFAVLYLFLQRLLVISLKDNKILKFCYTKHYFLFPIFVMTIFGTVTFPGFLGQHFAGDRLWIASLGDLFQNCTWHLSTSNDTVEYCKLGQLGVWSNYGRDDPMNVLMIFSVFSFIAVCVCSTLLVPMGAFIPTLVVGGAIGRLFGEAVSYYLPEENHIIFPGIYAVVGASAFCTGIIHSVSVAVIMLESVGQFNYSLPILIGVTISYSISKLLHPSLYDTVIKIKKLPYIHSTCYKAEKYSKFTVAHIMVKETDFICRDSTVEEVQNLLIKHPKTQTFPICDSQKSQILIGSCDRNSLEAEIEKQIENVESEKVESSLITRWKNILGMSIQKQDPLKSRKKLNSEIANAKFNLEEIEIDVAPFQFMKNVPLLQCYKIFTLMKLRRAYITNCGKLEGLITQTDLRRGIEAVEKREIPSRT